MPKDNRRNTSVQTANREFGFSTADRVRFVTEYVLSKVFYLWREVKTPRLRLFVYEIVYSLRQAVGRDPLAMRWLRIDRVETVFGTFNVRPGTGDVACASPAFERSDLNHFLALLEEPLIAGRSVLFLDIGAALGTYSVAVGNRLNGLGDIRVLAFEPSRSSFALLKRNLEDNGLAGVVKGAPARTRRWVGIIGNVEIRSCHTRWKSAGRGTVSRDRLRGGRSLIDRRGNRE